MGQSQGAQRGMIARKGPPGAEGPSHPRADYYRRERRDWGTHAYTGGDLPTKPNRFPVFGPQKSVTCAGRVFSSVENSSFRMNTAFGLFVGNHRILGRMALFGQDRLTRGRPKISRRLPVLAECVHPFEDPSLRFDSCAGRILSSVEDQSFRMNSPFG